MAFLEEDGVAPTNNFGERALRFAELWRKRNKGTQSNNGDWWIERILSLIGNTQPGTLIRGAS